jgi:thymidine kinase
MFDVAPGRIDLFVGPMYSRKTESLIRLLAGAASSGRTVLAVKARIDTRYGESLLESHSGLRFPATLAKDGADVTAVARGAEVVGVDEVQFFDHGLASAVAGLRTSGVAVVAAGLDLDFLRRPFPITRAVAEIADGVTRLRATCERCGSPADFTQRLVNGRPAPADDAVVRIGAHELYEARCGRCYEAEEALRPTTLPAAAS